VSAARGRATGQLSEPAARCPFDAALNTVRGPAVITFVAHEKRSMALSRVTDVPHIACTRGAGLSAACPSTKCLFKVHDSVGHGTVHYLFHALVACYAFVRRTRCIARSMVDCRLAGGCRVRGAMPDEGAKPSIPSLNGPGLITPSKQASTFIRFEDTT